MLYTSRVRSRLQETSLSSSVPSHPRPSHRVHRVASALAAAALAFAFACDQGSGTAGPGPDPGGCEHVDNAGGVELRLHGVQLYRQSMSQATGAIEVTDGGRIDSIEAVFLDLNGAAIPIPNDCTINELRFEIADPSVIEIAPQPGLRWFFDVVAKRQGATMLRVFLWHDNHAHFRSEQIPVEVVAP
jgi:hypothetical protein